MDDKYRSYILGEAEKNTKWRFGAPPNYDVVNKLFEEGRKKVWPEGSLEERVQHLVKTWEMEIFHKMDPNDFKTINPQKFTISVNGRPAVSPDEVVKVGGYNVMLQTSLPVSLRSYDPSKESSASSHKEFTTAFPRGFAWEVYEAYSGPPVIAYKFRHWAFMEGPFKGHPPTGEMVEFYGIGIFQVDESMRVERVEFFYDPGELLAPLIRNGPADSTQSSQNSSLGCPFLNKV